MKCKVITIKVALYEYDEDDEVIAMNEEDANDVYETIKGEGEVCGYCFHDITIDDEEIDL